MHPVFCLLFCTLLFLWSCKKESPSPRLRAVVLTGSEPRLLTLDCQFTNRDTGYVLGLNTEAGNYFNVLFTTVDGGYSWSRKNFPVPETGGVGRFFALSSKELYAYFHGIHKSTDGGATWKSLSDSLTNKTNTIVGLYFQTASFGLMANVHGIYRIENERTFTPVYQEGSGTSVKSFQKAGEAFFATAGSSGRIGILFKANSLMGNWQPQPFDKGFINSLHFINSSVGYAQVEYDVWQTKDGGGTWQKQTTAPLPSRSGMLHFTSENRGFYGTAEGALYFSYDKGQSWKLVHKAERAAVAKLSSVEGSLVALLNNGTVILEDR